MITHVRVRAYASSCVGVCVYIPSGEYVRACFHAHVQCPGMPIDWWLKRMKSFGRTQNGDTDSPDVHKLVMQISQSCKKRSIMMLPTVQRA